MKLLQVFVLSFLVTLQSLIGAPADLYPRDVNAKVNEFLFTHINQKKLTPELIQRSFENFIQGFDPQKSYLTQSEVDRFINPSEELLNQALEEFYKSKFTLYNELYITMCRAIERRQKIEKEILEEPLLEGVNSKEFEDMEWAEDEAALKQRLLKIRSFQNCTAEKIEDEQFKSKFLAIIDKRRNWREQELIGKNKDEQSQILHENILKSIACSLDSHSMYFSPEEAKMFMMEVQQKLVGIGVQLVDDLTGFRIVSILEDGPAKAQGGLKENDRIVAVDGEYVVGMDIVQAVQMIRGKEHTKVKLTLLREDKDSSDPLKVEVTLKRGEIVMEEARYEARLEPFGDGHLVHLSLHSFYQDQQSSCAADLYNKLSEFISSHKVKGVLLDLRNNMGGVLVQAVAVNSLFMGKGIVVSIKHSDGTLQHLRNVESNPIWDGPLVILVNRLSASASEIVAQSLQDYGRAIVVGDDRSFGKGTFQIASMNFNHLNVNPQGEYKVTQGIYYTVSGKSPQLVGVQSDVVAPSYLCESEVGEQYSKYPIENDQIASNFEDSLDDIPRAQIDRVKKYYHHDLYKKTDRFTRHLSHLKENTAKRIELNKDYSKFLSTLKEKDPEKEEVLPMTENDHQLMEGMNVLKDLVYLDEQTHREAI